MDDDRILRFQYGFKTRHFCGDDVPVVTEEFFIQAFGFFQQIDIVLLIARMDFQGGEFDQGSLDFFRRQALAVLTENLIDVQIQVFVADVDFKSPLTS